MYTSRVALLGSIELRTSSSDRPTLLHDAFDRLNGCLGRGEQKPGPRGNEDESSRRHLRRTDLDGAARHSEPKTRHENRREYIEAVSRRSDEVQDDRGGNDRQNDRV